MQEIYWLVKVLKVLRNLTPHNIIIPNPYTHMYAHKNLNKFAPNPKLKKITHMYAPKKEQICPQTNIAPNCKKMPPNKKKFQIPLTHLPPIAPNCKKNAPN